MKRFTSTWCFSSFEQGCIVGSVYSVVLHVLDLAWLIYAIVTFHMLRNGMQRNMQQNFLAPGVDIIAYVTLILTLIVLALSAVQIRWIKKGYQFTPHMVLWLWTAAGLRGFEACIGIYVLAFLGYDNLKIVAFTAAECIFGAIYWCVCTGALIFFCGFVVRYVYDLKQASRVGSAKGQRHKKPYMIHSNDVYSPTTCAILNPAQDEKGTPPVLKYKPVPKRSRIYFRKEEQRPQVHCEFESIV